MLQASGRSTLSISTKLGLLFSILCVPFVITHGQSSTPRQHDPRNTYKLSGTVLNAVTGDPIAHAMVEIAAFIKPAATLTDSNGNFELDGLAESQATVTVSKPGFFNDEQMSQFARSRVQTMVHIGPDTPSITLKLVPEGIIFGRVETSDGPAENIPVKVFWATVSNGRHLWQSKESRTDDDGNFRLAELFPGTYFIAAGPALNFNDMAVRDPTTVAYLPRLFHAGSSEFNGATAVELTAGQQVQVDFPVKKVTTYTISGKILGNDFNNGISLELSDRFGEPLSLPIHFNQGTRQFSLWAAPGSYILHASAQGQDGNMLRGQLAFIVSADRSNLEIVLAPSLRIAVNYRKEYVAPVPQDSANRGFVFGRALNAMPVSVSLYMVGDLLNPRSYWPEQYKNATGVSFRDVEPGKYSVEIDSNGSEWYVQSATCGGTDLLRDDLEVGTHVDPIEIVVRNGGSSILGKIHAVAGHAMHGDILLVRDGAPREVRTTNTSEDGNFLINGLAPGGYSVVALERLDGVEYRNPEVLNKYLTKAEHVNVEAGQQLETTVELTEIEK